MKIICVGRNYAKHIEELENEVPDEPVIFLKPDSARLTGSMPFFYPDYSNDIHYEAEIVLKVGRNGKHIQERFAHDYISEVTIGIDLTARDVQSRLKAKGLPWELAKGFDYSAVVGEFIPFSEIDDIQNQDFSLMKNGELVQEGNTRMMLFPIARLIAFISKFFILKQGDLIFTGTPAGVGPIAIEDRYEGFIGNKRLLRLKVK